MRRACNTAALALALALAPAALLLAPSIAEACSCMRSESALKSAREVDVVFTGKLVSFVEEQKQGAHDFPDKLATFEVTSTIKGNLDPQVIIETANNSAACGREFGKPGSEWLIYARRNDDGSLRDNLCSRSVSMSAPQAAEDIAALEGQDLDAPNEPDPEPSDTMGEPDPDPDPIPDVDPDPNGDPEPIAPKKKGCSVTDDGPGPLGLLALGLLIPALRRRRDR